MEVITNKNSKVLFLAHSPEIGGAEKSLIELVGGLSKKGVFCYVALPAEGSLANEFRRISIPVYIIYLPWSADGGKKYSRDRINEIGKSTLDIIRLASDISPDIIYSNSSVILQGAIAAQNLGIKHIWHIREFGESDYGIDFYLPIKERAKFAYEYSDKIIFISKALENYYHQYIPNNKSELVYNDVKIPEDDDENNVEKDEFFLNLLMVGNIHPAKGQLDAVEAMKILVDKGIKNIHLKIIGAKTIDYYNKISDFINNNKLEKQVEFFDFTPKPAKFFKEADIFLMCSRSEGFGRVTVEAMLFGKPVIGAHAGGTPEIIQDGENGVLYKPGDINDLAEKILFFYENRIKIKEFGDNGKLFCVRNFSEEQYIGKIRDIMEKVANNHTNSLFRKLFFSIFEEVKLIENKLSSTKIKLNLEENESKRTKLELRSIKSKMDLNELELREKMNLTELKLDSINKELNSAKKALEIARGELQRVYSSYEWRFVLILHRIIKITIPEGSWRRNIFTKLWKLTDYFLQLPLKFHREIRSAIFIIQNYFIKLKAKNKRKISLNSKKIVFIDHSYHSKTKSNDFILNFLKEFFEVTIILDDSWKNDGSQFPDLSFIDNNYLGVIFWQSLPGPGIIKNIKNDNIIYFPMYDQSGRLGIDFWNKYRNLKIINFSFVLHQKLKKWEFDTIHIQYFPKVKEFIPGNKKEIFFWQRLTNINVNTILKLLDKKIMKVHIHKAIDPNQKFTEPKKEDEEKFSITYSDWFETREEMLEVIRQKGIYIAPREYEGIGLSFLEAMAMGKAIIAVNNPTMNEYIEDGRTGYLFDLKNPKPIDLANIEEVQKNTYEFMKNGFGKWEKDRRKIIEFIKK